MTQGKPRRKSARLDVFNADPAGSSASASEARREALRTFVDRVRITYAHLWPATTHARSLAKPWPSCWEDHPGLVADLQYLKDWAAAIAAGDIEGDAYGARDSWRRYVHTLLVDDVRAISGRTCRHGHVDPTWRTPDPEPDIPEAPPLPGEVRPVPTASAAPEAARTDWAEYFAGSDWRRVDEPPVGVSKHTGSDGPDLS
jgi:hypothetical protein